jgi:hypothetical protein
MDNLDAMKILKTGVGFAIGGGVATIVSGFVQAVTAPETSLQRGLVFAGRTGISMLVSDLVKEHVNGKIDDAHEWVTTTFSKD